jgi:peptidoglycan/xylan/chitin deacetylase (PgdA/CDA1 family)
MFQHSSPLLLFEYFRVPSSPVPRRLAPVSEVGGLLESCSWVRSVDSRRLVFYASKSSMARIAPGLQPGGYQIRSMNLYGHVLPDSLLSGLLDPSWKPGEAVNDRRGRRLASIWRDPHGNVFLPFDPNQAVMSFWSEAYAIPGQMGRWRMRAILKAAYYHLRPLIPRGIQVNFRRLLTNVQERLPFPRWPIETSLHDFYEFLFEVFAGIAKSRIPTLAPWPRGCSWALVLTHDVETSTGYRNIHLLRNLEIEAGYRSSWNFVPRRYDVDDALVRDLLERGFEVGIHGLYHDGREFESLRTLKERIPVMREYAKRWNAVGFRSPATHRVWEWMPLLGFDYDSSYPDTDPYEPQPGGCCTWLPYFNDELVELPITLPQDYTLFTILRHENEQLWLEKARFLRDRGGMALLITHPDYMLGRRPRASYARFLDAFREDRTVWRALPREVSSWWRKRAASHLERTGQEWRIIGPASEAGRIIER